jgi:hypothetical protein
MIADSLAWFGVKPKDVRDALKSFVSTGLLSDEGDDAYKISGWDGYSPRSKNAERQARFRESKKAESVTSNVTRNADSNARITTEGEARCQMIEEEVNSTRTSTRQPTDSGSGSVEVPSKGSGGSGFEISDYVPPPRPYDEQEESVKIYRFLTDNGYQDTSDRRRKSKAEEMAAQAFTLADNKEMLRIAESFASKPLRMYYGWIKGLGYAAKLKELRKHPPKRKGA